MRMFVRRGDVGLRGRPGWHSYGIGTYHAIARPVCLRCGFFVKGYRFVFSRYSRSTLWGLTHFLGVWCFGSGAGNVFQFVLTCEESFVVRGGRLFSLEDLPVKGVLLLFLLVCVTLLTVPCVRRGGISMSCRGGFTGRSFCDSATNARQITCVGSGASTLLCQLRVLSRTGSRVVLSAFSFGTSGSKRSVVTSLLRTTSHNISIHVCGPVGLLGP